MNKTQKQPGCLLQIIGLVFFIYFGAKLLGVSFTTNQKVNSNVSKKAQITKSLLQDESKSTELAQKYCDARANSTRYYIIPVEKTTKSGKKGYELENQSRKQGSSLTIEDCLVIIAYLKDLDNKYATLLAPVNINDVINRKYWIGMSSYELYASLGIPNKINKSDYGAGEHDQNIYYKDSYGASAYYIYTQGGKVTSYQDF